MSMSPFASMVRSKKPWRAKSSSMWLKKGIPVETRYVPSPSRRHPTSILVSFVSLFTSDSLSITPLEYHLVQRIFDDALRARPAQRRDDVADHLLVHDHLEGNPLPVGEARNGRRVQGGEDTHNRVELSLRHIHLQPHLLVREERRLQEHDYVLHLRPLPLILEGCLVRDHHG